MLSIWNRVSPKTGFAVKADIVIIKSIYDDSLSCKFSDVDSLVLIMEDIKKLLSRKIRRKLRSCRYLGKISDRSGYLKQVMPCHAGFERSQKDSLPKNRNDHMGNGASISRGSQYRKPGYRHTPCKPTERTSSRLCSPMRKSTELLPWVCDVI